jgi:hypothetical protein
LRYDEGQRELAADRRRYVWTALAIFVPIFAAIAAIVMWPAS